MLSRRSHFIFFLGGWRGGHWLSPSQLKKIENSSMNFCCCDIDVYFSDLFFPLNLLKRIRFFFHQNQSKFFFSSILFVKKSLKPVIHLGKLPLTIGGVHGLAHHSSPPIGWLSQSTNRCWPPSVVNGSFPLIHEKNKHTKRNLATFGGRGGVCMSFSRKHPDIIILPILIILLTL